ncbi:hypothetical protein GMSM_06530 [Geomonas sp. Red276]
MAETKKGSPVGGSPFRLGIKITLTRPSGTLSPEGARGYHLTFGQGFLECGRVLDHLVTSQGEEALEDQAMV